MVLMFAFDRGRGKKAEYVMNSLTMLRALPAQRSSGASNKESQMALGTARTGTGRCERVSSDSALTAGKLESLL